ncbi:CCA tRNA nucleotidyltransferase [Marinicrinis lubricantis]|uniref:CCA tRNA nucleotidyltransferase n=1 Tax=Marinicrinis lubricantis TaxID=2086470 RepID=A0ABW1IM11_9BACL
MSKTLSLMEQEAVQVLEKLEQHGYLAFFVGGYVRDSLLGRPIHDIDLTTNALPEQVLHIFPHCIPTGLKHGTVTVMMEHHSFEVTTFRTESEYEQYRRPKKVEYVSRLEDDLRRRDFTMNAMAMNRHLELIDPFGGKKDIEDRLIRSVGNPAERFQEDALRLIRCVRFSANYGFDIEQRTEQALEQCSTLLKYIAMERVQAEWERMMAGPRPWVGLRHLLRHGFIRNLKEELPISPEMWEAVLHPGLEQWLRRLSGSQARWCAVLWTLNCDPMIASEALKILKYPNRFVEETAAVLHVLEQWKTWDGAHEDGIKPFIRWSVRYGREPVLHALSLLEQAPLVFQRKASDSFVQLLHTYGAKVQERLMAVPVQSAADLNVTGKDLITAGIRPGPRMGEILKTLLLQCALGDLPNEREVLLQAAGKWQEQGMQGGID